MVDVIDGSETVSTHGIINWILLLVIFSVITVVGNWIGYKHPISDSLIGMLILSIITLAGLLLERYLPFNVSSIIYISLIGIAVSIPMVPTSPFVVKYVGQVELLSIVTVFLAYVGIGIGKNWDQVQGYGLERYDSNYLYHYWNLPWICINCTHSFSSKRYTLVLIFNTI